MKKFAAVMLLFILLLSCGEDPSSPPTEEGYPTPSILQAEFTGGWEPDTGLREMAWEATLEWTECPDADFAAYEVFRSTRPGIADDSTGADLLYTTVTPADTQYVDHYGDFDAAHYYVIRTADTRGNGSWSNEECVAVSPESWYGPPDQIVQTIQVGAGPAGICCLPSGDYVYAACYYSQQVYVIETVAHTVVTAVPVSGNPRHVACDPAGLYVYVSDISGDAVQAINTSTNVVEWTIEVGADPAGLCHHPYEDVLYVACYGDDEVFVVDPGTASVSDTITVGSGPWGVTVLPSGDYAYVSSRLDGTVSVIRTSDNTVVATIDTGGDPKGLCSVAAGNYVWVADYSGDDVVVIDTGGQSVCGSFAAYGGVSELIELPEEQFVCSTCYTADAIGAMDEPGEAFICLIDAGLRPFDLCSTPSGDFVYVTASYDAEVVVLRY